VRCRVRIFPGFVARAVLLVCCLGTSSSAVAQTSRADIIAQEQEQKAAHLGREGPGPLENLIVRVEQSPLIAGTTGAYPWLGSVYSGTGLGMGAGYLLRMANGARLNGVAGLSTGGSWLLKFRAAKPEIAGEALNADLDARYTMAKDISFYGLGPSSRVDRPVRYDYRPFELGATASFQPAGKIRLSGKYQWMMLRTRTHSPSAVGASDLDTDLSYHMVQAGAVLDWRESPGYSTGGGFQRVTYSLYQEAHGRPYSFQALEYEAVQHVSFLRGQYGLAARGLVTLTETEGSDGVPVVLAPGLGGGETLRGFETRRFTDRNRLLFTGEYRWRPSRYLDMAAFFDAGKVGARRRDLGLSKLETDWGLGARLHGPDFYILRSGIAKSREGWQIVLGVGREML